MKKRQSSYLKRLKFAPALKKSWAYSFLGNIRITILMVITILLAGVFSLANLPRRINPDVEIPYIFVSTVYPGASPQDVEQQVTIPLEDAIKAVDRIKTISSSSQESYSTVFIEFESGVKNNQATTDIQSAVDAVTNLPSNSLEPLVLPLDFEDVPVVSFSLVSENDLASLMNFSRQLQDELESLPAIQKVTVSGLEKNELEIFIDPEVQGTYSVSPFLVQQAVQTALSSYPSGILKTDLSNISLGVELPGQTIETLRNLPINLGQSSVILGELAAVSLRSAPDQANSFFADQETNPVRAVTFSVYKTVAADLEASAQLARQTVQEEIKKAGGQYRFLVITDFSQDIADMFSDLIWDFLASLVLVFVVLLIFLGIRQAGIASIVIPLSFFATFAVMYAVDIQLSFLSIFSLLLGLGMIVDDAIVMVSAMTDYYRTGKFTPLETAVLVWNDFWTPTLTSNLTNIWSFLPLLIATGIIGEFTKVISFVVTIALVASTIIALLVTLPFMVVVLRPKVPRRVIVFLGFLVGAVPLILILMITKGNPLIGLILVVYFLLLGVAWVAQKELFLGTKKTYRRYFGKFLKLPALKTKLAVGFLTIKGPIFSYKQFLARILKSKSAKRKVLVTIILLSVFSYFLVPLGLIDYEFFPKTDEDNLYVSLELPIGTRLEETETEALTILQTLKNIPDVEYVLLDVGAEVEMGIASQLNQTNIARYSLKLNEKRKSSSFEVAQNLRNTFSSYTKGKLQVTEITGGPPAGADIEMRLTGEETAKLQELAQKVQSYLEAQPGTANANISIKPGLSKLVFVPDIQRLTEVGLSIDQVGINLRTFVSGFQLDSFLLEENGCQQDCPIQLRLSRGDMAPEDLGRVNLTNSRGQRFNLLSLGELQLQQNPTRVTRLDGKRSIAVTASVLPDFNQVKIGQELEKFVDTEMDLPQGYDWQTGGMNEENQKSVNSIIQAMVLAAVLILGTMVVELKSFRQAVIVMLVIPLAISGVFIVFGLTGTPLSFPALVGILALFGIVVKNSILIVDKINRNLKIGLPFDEAIADGASSRLEPIIFSSVTNIIGLTPITLSDPLWRGLGGAIISGLTLSGLIMLFFIPLVYDAWYRKR